MRKNSVLMKLVGSAFVVCCAFGSLQRSSHAQGRALTAQQLDTIVTTRLQQCTTPPSKLASGRLDPSGIIPTRNAREFPNTRIAKTLHGMWRGKVLGDDKDVGVDYFWIMDTKRNEGLIIAQRTGSESMAELQPVPKAPKLTYLMCAHEGYFPSKDTPQIHEFTKVSNTIDDAPRVVQKATGMKLPSAKPTLADMWRELVASQYFNTLHGVAYAGGFFNPLTIKRVASDFGPAQVSLKWDGEYRGGGATSLKFTNNVAIKGVEHAQFVGMTASSGDYLVSSPGNGKLWKVEATVGATYDLAFDQVTLGPLQ
jgi:hypothetical protein